mmetsp:Transcript_102498/g.187262  ORF Transcript_102498/g.187262 Transcript_102498/m.187262 type:complete len:658 (+) Transcript_102498:59-2032(+)
MEAVSKSFRRYLVSDPEHDTIEWEMFCQVLQKLNPSTYNDDYLNRIFSQFLLYRNSGRSGKPLAESNGIIQLQDLITWIFSGCNDVAQQAVPPEQPCEECCPHEVVTSVDPGNSNTLKRQKTGELSKAPSGSLSSTLHVRTIAGKEVLCFHKDDLVDFTVLQLREKAVDVVGHCIDEIKIVFNLRTLEDKESLEELVAGEYPCELLCITQQLPQFNPEVPALEQLDVLRGLLMATSPTYRICAAREIRKLLSIEHNPPIDTIVGLGVVPRLLELSQDTSSPELQFESMWALTNIASGTNQQTQAIVDLGAVPVFVQLLATSSENDLCEQTVWAIGNVAGDSTAYRDLCLGNGALTPIVKILNSETCAASLSLMRNATWALSNLCRGKPPPLLDLIKPALDTLDSLLHHDDVEVLTDACWAVSYVLDSTFDGVEAGIQAGICPRLVELLAHPTPQVQSPALRAVGNIAAGSDRQTETILNCGVLPMLKKLLQHAKKSIRKETCWMLSNILGGTVEQTDAVIDAGLLPMILDMLRGDETHDVAKEAAHCLGNASSHGKAKHVQHLIDAGCVGLLVRMLHNTDSKMTVLALETVKNIMETQGEQDDEHPFQNLLESALEVEQLEALAQHEAESVAERATFILEKYFPGTPTTETTTSFNS